MRGVAWSAERQLGCWAAVRVMSKMSRGGQRVFAYVMDLVRRDQTGEFRLPRWNEMKSGLGMWMSQVQKALDELEDLGIAYRDPIRRGLWVLSPLFYMDCSTELGIECLGSFNDLNHAVIREREDRRLAKRERREIDLDC